MIRLILLQTIFLLSSIVISYGQEITDKWELDYNSVEDCEGNRITQDYFKQSGKSVFEFYNNHNYRRYIWGWESGGTFKLQDDTLWLDEIYQIGNKEGSERGKHFLGVEKLKNDTLIITFIECDQKVTQTYLKFNDDVAIISWPLIKGVVENMTDSTTYDQIINTLGKPYDKFATPSLPEEYVLYFDIPNEPGYMYWIMLNTQTKNFLYWGTEKQKKNE